MRNKKTVNFTALSNDKLLDIATLPGKLSRRAKDELSKRSAKI